MAVENLANTGLALGTINSTSKKVFLLQQEINMDTTPPTIDSLDVVNSILVPSNATVLCVILEVLVPADCTTSATLTVGCGATSLISNLNVNRNFGVSSHSTTQVTVANATTFITVTPTFSGTITKKGKYKLLAICAQL